MTDLNPIEPSLIKKVVKEAGLDQSRYEYEFNPTSGRVVGKRGEDVGTKSSIDQRMEKQKRKKEKKFQRELDQLIRVGGSAGGMLDFIIKKRGPKAGLMFKKWVDQGGSHNAIAQASDTGNIKDAAEIILLAFKKWAQSES